MGSKSQRKGAFGERELAAILRERGYDCQRGGSLTFGEVPDLTGLPGIHAEIKRVERLNVGEANKTLTKRSQNTASLPGNSRKAGLCRQELVQFCYTGG